MAVFGRRVGAFVAVTLVALVLAPPILAVASNSEGSGSGTFAETSFVGVPTITTTADGSTLISQTTVGTYSGTISGTFTEVLSAVVFVNGTQSFSGFDMCVCSIAGHTGTFVDRFDGTGVVPNFAGNLAVIRGTGHLRDVHATAKFTGAVDSTGLASGQYSIHYRFSP